MLDLAYAGGTFLRVLTFSGGYSAMLGDLLTLPNDQRA